MGTFSAGGPIIRLQPNSNSRIKKTFKKRNQTNQIKKKIKTYFRK